MPEAPGIHLLPRIRQVTQHALHQPRAASPMGLNLPEINTILSSSTRLSTSLRLGKAVN